MALDVGCGEVGRPPYPLVLMLKMLLLAYLFNLSERQVAVYVQENLPARWFVGLAVNAPRLLIQGRFCLDTEKGDGHEEVRIWTDDTGWGGSSGLNEACERAAKAAQHFSADFFSTLTFEGANVYGPDRIVRGSPDAPRGPHKNWPREAPIRRAAPAGLQ